MRDARPAPTVTSESPDTGPTVAADWASPGCFRDDLLEKSGCVPARDAIFVPINATTPCIAISKTSLIGKQKRIDEPSPRPPSRRPPCIIVSDSCGRRRADSRRAAWCVRRASDTWPERTPWRTTASSDLGCGDLQSSSPRVRRSPVLSGSFVRRRVAQSNRDGRGGICRESRRRSRSCRPTLRLPLRAGHFGIELVSITARMQTDR